MLQISKGYIVTSRPYNVRVCTGTYYKLTFANLHVIEVT